MQLWWCLRHFSPECWKSSAKITNWWRKMILIRKIFSFENVLWAHRGQFYWTFRIFWPEAPKSSAQNQQLMRKINFLTKVFFPIRISSWSVEGRFGNPTTKFFVKGLRSYCSQSKITENDKNSNKFFSKIGSSGHFGFRLDNPTGKCCAINRHLLSLENGECEAQISNKKFSQKLPLGGKCIIGNPAENSSHEVRKLLLGVRENQRTVYFQNFFS